MGFISLAKTLNSFGALYDVKSGLRLFVQYFDELGHRQYCQGSRMVPTLSGH